MSRPSHSLRGLVVRSSGVALREMRARTALALAIASLAMGCSAASAARGPAVKTATSPSSNSSSNDDEAGVASAERESAARAGAAEDKDTQPGRKHATQAKMGDEQKLDPATRAGAGTGTVGQKRVWAGVGLLRILDKPDRDAPVIGAMRNGQSVALRDDKPVTARKSYQCTDGWYPVQPRGWVCVGGPGYGRLDDAEPVIRAAEEALPDRSKPYPFHFGVSVGAPRYLRMPTAAEQRKAEPELDRYLATLPTPDPTKGGAVSVARAGHGPSEALLAYFRQPGLALTAEEAAYEGMKVSWTKEFDGEGRTWLLTPDLQLIPKDKVRQQPLPNMRGVDLRAQPDMALPLAFTWLQEAVKYRRDEQGNIVPTKESWSRHSFIPATGGMAKGDHGRWYWEMRDGSLAFYPDVTILKTAPRPQAVGPKDKWLHVRVTWGWAIAYEGSTPVYATAISPGIDGISSRAHATAKGKQHVDWKLLSSDMSGRDKGKDWFVDEVPWTQYYKGNFAVHGAWWHDDFGRPKSHGCINVPPADAMWLFGWMDPQLPDGWYAVSPYAPIAKSTLIYIQY